MSVFLWIVLVAFLIWLWNSVFRVKEGEQGVVLRLGRLRPEPLLPGLRLAFWPVETLHRISVEPQTLVIATRELVARGDAELKAGARCAFRVVDAGRAVAGAADYRSALEELAAERMLQAVGQVSVDEVLYAPAAVNEQIRKSLEDTARAWGLEILSFELVSEGH